MPWDTLIDMDDLVLGKWKAWRGEGITKLRSSRTVLFRLRGNYTLKIALIVSRKELLYPPFLISFTSYLLQNSSSACLSGKHPPQRWQYFNDLSSDPHWNTHYLLQTLHFNSHFHLETESGGLEMLMNKEVIIDSQFLLLQQLSVFLIFVICPSKSLRVNCNFNIMVSLLTEGGGFSLQEKKVRLYTDYMELS